MLTDDSWLLAVSVEQYSPPPICMCAKCALRGEFEALPGADLLCITARAWWPWLSSSSRRSSSSCSASRAPRSSSSCARRCASLSRTSRRATFFAERSRQLDCDPCAQELVWLQGLKLLSTTSSSDGRSCTASAPCRRPAMEPECSAPRKFAVASGSGSLPAAPGLALPVGRPRGDVGSRSACSSAAVALGRSEGGSCLTGISSIAWD
mmetsp:Transcript_87413/g.255635  ORF Transcript_87413/g.255635 Transcript_87413/m.255635 type:complete len:208 (-) Transcript_87413:1574-2197(-)